MLIPSIDIKDGRAVQLKQGRTLILDGGDPLEVARRFAPLGEIAVIDLDAALGTGDNRAVIESLLPVARCRVGGGIRDAETALGWLDSGATRVMIGTAAEPELLARLPRERVMAAVDAWEDEVVVEGWQTGTGERVSDRIDRLRPFVGGFLATFVQDEGTGSGLDLDRARMIRRMAGDLDLVVAGGTRDARDVAKLDTLGVDVQVGRALYDGSLGPSAILAAMLTSDRPDGLWPTVVCDESGQALGLAYSSDRSLERTIETGRVCYESRRRGLWEKGATSGATQRLLKVDLDCDRDSLRFVVEQSTPGFCHRRRWTCWDGGTGMEAMERRIVALARSLDGDADSSSYTRRLTADPSLLRSKLEEEAAELGEPGSDTVHEAADLAYFMMVTLVQRGVPWREVVAELERRTLRVRRRGGDAKVGTPASEVIS